MMHSTLLLALGLAGSAKGSTAPHPSLRQVIFYLADDFGWYNAGFQGNTEVKTPTLDRLAASGIILSRHYAFM